MGFIKFLINNPMVAIIIIAIVGPMIKNVWKTITSGPSPGEERELNRRLEDAIRQAKADVARKRSEEGGAMTSAPSAARPVRSKPGGAPRPLSPPVEKRTVVPMNQRPAVPNRYQGEGAGRGPGSPPSVPAARPVAPVPAPVAASFPAAASAADAYAERSATEERAEAERQMELERAMHRIKSLAEPEKKRKKKGAKGSAIPTLDSGSAPAPGQLSGATTTGAYALPTASSPAGRSGRGPGAGVAVGTGRSVFTRLQGGANLRDAIILTEVLQRPKAMRPERSRGLGSPRAGA